MKNTEVQKAPCYLAFIDRRALLRVGNGRQQIGGKRLHHYSSNLFELWVPAANTHVGDYLLCNLHLQLRQLSRLADLHLKAVAEWFIFKINHVVHSSSSVVKAQVCRFAWKGGAL